MKAKNIAFYTSGRLPLEQDFAHISEWIKRKSRSKNFANRPNMDRTKAYRPTEVLP